MKDKEQNINLWNFKDIMMSAGYITCWMMITWGFLAYFCTDCNEIFFPIITQIILTIMVGGVIYYFAVKKPKNSLSIFLGTNIKKRTIVLTSIAASFLLVLSTSLINFGILELTNQETPDIYKGLENKYLLLFSSFAVLISPLSEELFFRGFLQPVVVKKWGLWLGILITALLFSLSHLQYISYTSTFLGILIIGIILGILKEKTASLLPCILAHFLNNAIAVFYLLS